MKGLVNLKGGHGDSILNIDQDLTVANPFVPICGEHVP